MRLAIDLDEVVYSWDRTAHYMLREYRGYNRTTLPGQSPSWTYIPDTISKFDWQWLWTEGVKLGLFRYGHMVTGARIGLQHLRDAGHEIVVVTHRPEQATSDTLDWVGHYFKDIPLAGLHILSDEAPKSTVKADLLIDDKMESCLEWRGTTREPAILFDHPWNRGSEEAGILRARDWKHVIEIVEMFDYA